MEAYQLPDHQRGDISMRIFFAALLLTLSGCASAGTKVDPSKLATIQVETTTYQDVVTQLGMPNANSIAPDGTRTIVYVYMQTRARAQSFIPVVGALVAKADSNTETHTFTFDKNGVLKTKSQSNSQVTAGVN
jgi:ABC-type Fe3+-hydroxamate transport system substrate-binding protein